MRVISKKSRKLGSDQSFAALVLSAPAVFLMLLFILVPFGMSEYAAVYSDCGAIYFGAFHSTCCPDQ